MPFISDDQRKAAFARMRGAGGGGSRRPTGTRPPRQGINNGLALGGKTLLQILGPAFQPRKRELKPNGPGISYTQGVIRLTGGAIYNTPGSEWFIAPPPPTEYGTLPEVGVVSPTDITIQTFQPSTTIWGSLHYIINGIDPNSGNVLPPHNTPGQVKGPLALPTAHEAIGRNAGSYNAFVGGVGPDAIPARLRTRANVYNLPGWLQWFEEHQDIPDITFGGLTFSFNPDTPGSYNGPGY